MSVEQFDGCCWGVRCDDCRKEYVTVPKGKTASDALALAIQKGWIIAMGSPDCCPECKESEDGN